MVINMIDQRVRKLTPEFATYTIAKMGLVLCDMIDGGWVQSVVSTGALMAHGFVEATGQQSTDATLHTSGNGSDLVIGRRR